MSATKEMSRLGASRDEIAAEAERTAADHERALRQVREFKLLADVSWHDPSLPSFLILRRGRRGDIQNKYGQSVIALSPPVVNA